MKKSIFLLSLISIFFVGVIHAQDATPSGENSTVTSSPTPTEAPFNFEKAYKDYVYNGDLYNKSHSEYLLAKGQYLQAKTLASQSKAQEATAALLISRDNLIVTYLIAIRQKATEAEGIDPTILNGLTSRIDTEISWFRNHKGKIDSAASLSDLTADSSEAFKHYPTTEALVYETLSNIPLGKEQALRNSLNEILGSTKDKVSQIRANNDHDTTNAERWILETNNKLSRSLDKEVEAQKLFPSLQTVDTSSNKVDKKGVYNQVILRLGESVQYLREASSYMREVIKSIKTKQ